MSKNYNEMSHIEAYLRGVMEAAERRGFEAQLATDAALQAEVAAYRQIFTGFEGLRETAFASDVAAWAKASGSDNVVPMKQGATLRPMWLRLAAAASVVLLLGVGAAWWGSSHYADVAIAQRGYVAPLSSGTMGADVLVTEVEERFDAAHRAFQQGDFAGAALQFENIRATLGRNAAHFDALTLRSWLDNARWSGLLARFAAGKITTAEMAEELDAIAEDPASEYAARARVMRLELGSFWRRL